MATLRSQFHERQFEFCANADLVQTVGALIAGYIPGIPSPQQEADLGWDAHVPMPTYGLTYLLQYKVSRYTTKLAGANSKFWRTYGNPYYRFSLHADKYGDYAQHQLLLDAAAPGVEPVYCAPRFYETKDLIGALQRQAVISRSELIPVASLGPVTSGQAHSVTYPADHATGQPHVHSERRRGERLQGSNLAGRRPSVALDENLFGELSTRVLEGRRRWDVERQDRLETSETFEVPSLRRPRRRIHAEDPRANAYLEAAATVEDELGATLVVIPLEQAES